MKQSYSLQKYILGNKNVTLVSLKLDFFVFEMDFPFTACYLSHNFFFAPTFYIPIFNMFLLSS